MRCRSTLHSGGSPPPLGTSSSDFTSWIRKGDCAALAGGWFSGLQFPFRLPITKTLLSVGMPPRGESGLSTTMHRFSRRILSAACSFALLFAAARTASAVAYDFVTLLPSSDRPGETGPYARLTLTQDGPDKVDFRFEALALASSEFLSYLKFNIEDSATSPGFTIEDKRKTGLFEDPSFAFQRTPKTDAGSLFDVFLEFSTSGSARGAKRFTEGDIFEWSLSRPGFQVDDVALPMLIHLQGIMGGGSAKITALNTPPTAEDHGTRVPDGGPMLVLLALGLLALRTVKPREPKP